MKTSRIGFWSVLSMLIFTGMQVLAQTAEQPTEYVPSWVNPDYAVQVRMYRGGLVGPFKELDRLGELIMEETSRGYIIFSQIYREDFHQGVTACFQIDPRVLTVAMQKSRIVEQLSALRPEGEFVQFEVESPSHCWK